MCTAYTNLANIPYKLSIEQQRSIVDAWGLDLQNDIFFVNINFNLFVNNDMCKQRAFSAPASWC